jgi:hypothetical protein
MNINKLASIRRIAEIYNSGGNIIKHLKSVDARVENTLEDVLISYDFQAGSYIQNYKTDPLYLEKYTDAVVNLLIGLGDCKTLLEAGCGEATTLSLVGKKVRSDVKLAGFDISWSRVKLGMGFAASLNVDPSLFCGDLFNIPLRDHSVDIVYTSHSIEPNGGKEVEAIRELARVARKWLVLLEPGYDLASEEARRRMEEHGYVRNLAAAIRSLGLHLQSHVLFPTTVNPLNPTALYLIRIDDGSIGMSESFQFQCPITKVPLALLRGAYYARDSYLAYPILDGIPCLMENNAILATKYLG